MKDLTFGRATFLVSIAFGLIKAFSEDADEHGWLPMFFGGLCGSLCIGAWITNVIITIRGDGLANSRNDESGSNIFAICVAIFIFPLSIAMGFLGFDTPLFKNTEKPK